MTNSRPGTKVRAHAGGLPVVLLMGLLLCVVLPGSATAQEAKALLRFPDVHGDLVVFVYGEDIWSVPVQGGTAARLTIHDGVERFPKFSPDGGLIAFTGQYGGNADVYVMNRYGGDITRVTFHPGGDEVVGWHPTFNKIMFSSTRHSFNRFSRLYLISPDGTGLEELIMYEAARGSFSPDGSKVAYNRVAREHRTWKRYQGGLAQEVYVYDFATQEEVNITNFPGTDRIPMWIDNSVYFSSDRDGVLNIYAYQTDTGEMEQITRHEDFDVRRPSQGGNHIVYELGGNLWLLDVQNKQTRPIPIEVQTDLPELRPHQRPVDGYITHFDISPTGQRALVVARGEVFTVPKEDGPTRNLTNSSGARDKDAAWSPDGRTIAYLSDASGEYEIWLVDPLGRKQAVKLTQHPEGYRHTLRWSPDSKKIAFTDQTLRCYVLDVASREITEVDRAEFENVDVALDLKPIHDFTWSPNSRYLAYSKMDRDLVTKVYIYVLETGRTHCVSQGLFNDFAPEFSRDGRFLFFVSNRRFDPTFCDFEWELVYKDAAGIYAVALQRDGQPLLPYRSDEEPAGAQPADSEAEADESALTIDFEGIAERIEALPLPPGNYRSLTAGDNVLFYLNGDEGDYNRFEYRGPGSRDLFGFSFTDRQPHTVIQNVSGYRLSADGKHIVYRRGGTLGLVQASARDSQGGPLNLSGLTMWFEPLKEWTQIFNEAWRMERDFYYEPDMHGVDWDAMREKYGRLLTLASCRQDIQFLIGELIGELNTSHTYISGGDLLRRADRVNIGLLGTDWERDESNNRYRFKKIYRVADYSRGVYPPLTRPGMNLKDGDYLLAVNGREVKADRNIYSYFQGLAGQQVSLMVNSSPSMEGAREVVTRPIGGEYTLRYLDWVERNRRTAEEASGGRIGYIHLPDTYLGSSLEFPKYFYAQMRKQGLIIDGRFNGGGLDPDIFLRRLDKPLHAFWTRRYSHDQTIPDFVTTAHMVCLTNRQAGSGGDMLPMEFKKRNLGPVIGTRSWGGLVGVSTTISLIDGGGLTSPDYRIYDTDGSWIVENTGVSPDIAVDLTTAEVARGHDAQLMKGIELLLQKIEAEPRPWPQHGAYPQDKQVKKK
jgi:tricorn protease